MMTFTFGFVPHRIAAVRQNGISTIEKIMAPTIYVNGTGKTKDEAYDSALKEAKQRCYLSTRFPNEWFI